MSEKIFGDINKIDFVNLNKTKEISEEDVNIPSFLNRKTEASTLNKYLATAGGFHMGLWQEPLVARLPNGEKYLFDGDHRRALWRMAFPKRKTLPVQIVDVSTKQEISDLFIIINKTGRKALTPNELFVHQYHSGDADSVKAGEALKKARLCVSLGTGIEGSVVGSTGYNDHYVEVNINGFKKALVGNSVPNITRASSLIQEAFPNDKRLSVELLQGLSNVMTAGYTKPKEFLSIAKVFFTPWFIGIAEALGTQARLVATFKRDGGGQNAHKSQYSIALGILKGFKKAMRRREDAVSIRTINKYFNKSVAHWEEQVTYREN
jgi:hypothetical protein